MKVVLAALVFSALVAAVFSKASQTCENGCTIHNDHYGNAWSAYLEYDDSLIENSVYAFAFDGSPLFHSYWSNAEFDANHAFCKETSYTSSPHGGYAIPYGDSLGTTYLKWHNWCSVSSWSNWYYNYGSYDSAMSGKDRNTKSISEADLPDYKGTDYYLYRSYLGCLAHKPDQVYLYRYQLNFGSKDSSQNSKVIFLDSSFVPTNDSWTTFCQESFGGLYPGFFPEIPADRDFSVRGSHYLIEYNSVAPFSSNCSATIGSRGKYVASKCAPGQVSGLWPTVQYCYGVGEVATRSAVRFNCDLNKEVCESFHIPVQITNVPGVRSLEMTPQKRESNAEEKPMGNGISKMNRREFGEKHDELKRAFEKSVDEMKERGLLVTEVGEAPPRQFDAPGSATSFSRVVPPHYLTGYHTVFPNNNGDAHQSSSGNGDYGVEEWSNDPYDGFNHFVLPGENAFTYNNFAGTDSFNSPGELSFGWQIYCFHRDNYVFSSPNFQGYSTCSADRLVGLMSLAIFLVFLLL